MGRRKKKNPSLPRPPIMLKDEERYLAYVGFIQWAKGVVLQSKRVAEASDKVISVVRAQSGQRDQGEYIDATYSRLCEEHYYVIAVYKFREYQEWVREFGLFENVNFDEIDSMPWKDITDLRNMREHVVDYFRGAGKNQDRWWIETPEYKADASSTFNTLLGGRLDYVKFTEAVERILPDLMKEPTPYPVFKFPKPPEAES